MRSRLTSPARTKKSTVAVNPTRAFPAASDTPGVATVAR
jgi:hypothetical protein